MFYDDRSPFMHRAQWKLVLSLLPRRCKVSRKLLWLRYAYRGVAVWNGPGDPVEEVRWVSREEFLFGKIAGKL